MDVKRETHYINLLAALGLRGGPLRGGDVLLAPCFEMRLAGDLKGLYGEEASNFFPAPALGRVFLEEARDREGRGTRE